MEKYFGRAYRGDPGIPHTRPGAFANVWIGTAIFVVHSFNNPYLWQVSNEFNFCDLAMLYEQYHARRALTHNKSYKSVWNFRSRRFHDSYYEKWPVYFP